MISGAVLLISFALNQQITSPLSSTVDENSELQGLSNAASSPPYDDLVRTDGYHSSHIPHIIEGHVVDYWGKPISGIRLRLPAENSTTHTTYNTTRAVSNSAGYFRIEANQVDRYVIVTEATAVYKSATSIFDETSQMIQIELVLRDRILVSGKVTDSSGIPIIGATVYGILEATLATTDSDGRFQIDIPISNFAQPRISIVRGGFKAVQLALDTSDYIDRHEIDITLEFSEQTMTVHGWIGNTDGQPLSHQQIQLTSPPNDFYEADIEDYFAYSNIDGFFEIEGVIVDTNYQLLVYPKPPHRRLIKNNVYVSANMIPISITLGFLELNSITGIVTDFELQPLPKIQMSVNSEVSGSYSSRFITDDAGQFYLEQFPVGEVTFQTFPPLHRVLGMQVPPSRMQAIKVPIDYGWYTFSGRVNKIDGNPVALALVELEANIQLDDAISYSNRKTFTDSDGYFEFNNIGKGLHRLSVYTAGSRSFQRSYNIGPRTIVEHITLY